MHRALAVFCLAVVSACGSTEPSEDLKGSYELASVNGQPLPFRTTLGNLVTTLDQARLIVRQEGAFSLQSSGTQTVAGEVPSSTISQILTGTWHAEGNMLTLTSFDLTFNPPLVITASYEKGTLTYSDGANTYAYRRD